MASITLENSYQSTNKDMGNRHIIAHSHQHNYLQKNEPKIETLTPNNADDDSVKIALKYAQAELGLLKPLEWQKYNSGLRKSRRKANYTEYIIGISSGFLKAKERQLDNPKATKKNREKNSREIKSIIENSGIPLDGSIYYISNTEIYDNLPPEQLKNYRLFERKTFEKFFQSSTFKSLNPQNIRAEIHFDEAGAMHLQVQDVWFHKDKRRRIMYAKKAIIKNILRKWYGNENALQNRLDVLCEFDEIARKQNKKIGTKRGDYMFLDYVKKYPLGQVDDQLKINADGSSRKYKHSAAERNTKLEQLWRIEQIDTLGEIAEETAKNMGIDYHVNKYYSTDGVHLDGAAYIAHKKASQDAQKAMSLATQVKNASQDALDNLNSTYTAISGEESSNNSPLEVAKAIKQAAHNTKSETDNNQKLIKRQKQRITQQQQQLANQQRQLRDLQKQRDALKKENQDLSKENTSLKASIEQLHKQLKSAGLIVSGWIKEHWKQLEQHFNTYARDINAANNERINGGRDGNGDPDTADRFEKRAKNGLIGAFENVERHEADKAGLNNLWTTSGKQKDNELQR